MKKKVYSKLLLVSAIGFLGASVITTTVAVSGNHDDVVSRVDAVSEAKPYLIPKQTGLVGAWNPNTTFKSGCYSYAFSFVQDTGYAADESVDYASVMASHMKLGGVYLSEIEGCGFTRFLGANYISIWIPASAFTEDTTFEIEEFDYGDSWRVPHLTYSASSSGAMSIVSCDFEQAESCSTVANFSAIPWNNLDYSNFGGHGTTMTDGMCMLINYGLDSDLANASSYYMYGSIKDHILANGVPFSSIAGTVVYKYGDHIYIYAPDSAFGTNVPCIEFDDSVCIGGKKLEPGKFVFTNSNHHASNLWIKYAPSYVEKDVVGYKPINQSWFGIQLDGANYMPDSDTFGQYSSAVFPLLNTYSNIKVLGVGASSYVPAREFFNESAYIAGWGNPDTSLDHTVFAFNNLDNETHKVDNIAAIYIPKGTEIPGPNFHADCHTVYVTTKDIHIQCNVINDIANFFVCDDVTTSIQLVENGHVDHLPFKFGTNIYQSLPTGFNDGWTWVSKFDYNERVLLTLGDDSVIPVKNMTNSNHRLAQNNGTYIVPSTADFSFSNVKSVYIPKGTVFPSVEAILATSAPTKVLVADKDYIFDNLGYGCAYPMWIERGIETTKTAITGIYGWNSFEQSGSRFTNLEINISNMTGTDAGQMQFTNGRADSILKNLKFYDADDQLISTPVDSTVMFANWSSGNNFLIQFKGSVDNLAKVVCEAGMIIPSIELENGSANKYYELENTQTFYLHNNKLVEKTTVQFGENAAMEWYKGDALGNNIPATPAHEVDPEGKITYSGYWKDADGNRVTGDTVINEATHFTDVGYDESATVYNVKFMDGETELTDLAMSLAWNTTGVALPAVPTVTGYDGEWVSEQVTPSQGKFDMVVGNVVFKTKYTAQQFTLSFDGITDTVTVTYDSAIGELPAVPEKTGYHDGAWYIGETKIDASTVWNYTEGKQATAKYVINSYSVTFDTDGGSSVEGQTVNYGGKVTKPADPTKENMHFAGWYADEQLQTPFDFDNDVISDDTVIYAKFIDHQFDIQVTWSGKTATAVGKCSVDGCEVEISETKVGEYHEEVAPTCHSYSQGYWTVAFDDTRLGSSESSHLLENTDIEKPSHVYGEVEYEWNDDKTECIAIKECVNDGCEDFVTEEGVITYAVTTEPTCTEKGVGTYTATFATLGSDEKTVDIPALGHDVETIDGEPATCKEDGYKEAYYCNNCKAYYEDEACENLIGDLEALEAWRDGDGKLAKENVPHTPADSVKENIVAPTCTEAGSHDEVVYCTVCGEVISRTPVTDPALGHDMSPVAGKDATCSKDGYKAAFFCETCEKYFEDEAGANLIGDADAYASWKLAAGKLAKDPDLHVPTEAVIENVVKATCTEDGSHDEVVYCSVCGEELSRTPVTDKATGHTPAEAVRENIVEPTCTEAGSYDEVVYCSVCGEELSRTKIDLPATGHVWNEGEVTKPATCTENGVMTFTCECGETKTEVIPSTGHKLGELIPEVAATTEKEGMKAHYVCSECGQYFDANKMACTKESLVIAKLPEPTPEKKGCGGSVIAASAVVTGLAIAGAALIAAKKKED